MYSLVGPYIHKLTSLTTDFNVHDLGHFKFQKLADQVNICLGFPIVTLTIVRDKSQN